jgi:hypothetical protein
MATDPKPFLEYLDKEMTIMGLLSAFSIAVASFTTERIVSSEKGFLSDLWRFGQGHVIVGSTAAVLGALYFYLQRSHLAWYYGEIALAQSKGESESKWMKTLLKWVHGWDTWVRYQTGFGMLTVAFASYGYAVASTLHPLIATVSLTWSLWIPLVLALCVMAVRWRILISFAYEDHPFITCSEKLFGVDLKRFKRDYED